MIQIQKNVPMPDAPPAVASKAAVQKYPWASMEVTNSFYIAGKNEGKTKRYLGTLLSKAGKKYGKKFIFVEVPTGFNVFCTMTGIGTPEAKQWDYIKKEIVPGPFKSATKDSESTKSDAMDSESNETDSMPPTEQAANTESMS